MRARALLEAADRQKDEFLAMLAHELRNPLAPIRNAGEILSRVCADIPRAGRAVGIVQRQVANLTRLVDDLLDVSRITQGRVVLQWRSVQLADVVTQAVETVEPLMKERGMSCRSRCTARCACAATLRAWCSAWPTSSPTPLNTRTPVDASSWRCATMGIRRT